MDEIISNLLQMHVHRVVTQRGVSHDLSPMTISDVYFFSSPPLHVSIIHCPIDFGSTRDGQRIYSNDVMSPTA